MVLLHQAFGSLSTSTEQYLEGAPSLLDICSHAGRLYDGVDYEGKMFLGTEPYPRPIDCGAYDNGMKISLRYCNVLRARLRLM